MKTSIGFSIAVIASSVSLGLQAQQNQIEIDDTVVVVGSRTPTKISDIPGSVWVVDRNAIEQQLETGADLKTMLGKLVPGLDLAPQGRTNYGQNLRGRSVQVLINGVSLNNSRGLSRQFDSIDPFNVERIEVMSGASSLYGGGATGGIINIITKKGSTGGVEFTTQLGASSGFNSGDDKSKRFKHSISDGNDDVQAYLGLAYEENGRFYDGNGDEIFPDITQTDLQDNRTVDILGSVDIKLTEEQTLELGAQIYRSNYTGERGLYFPNINAVPVGSLQGAEIRDGFRSDRAPATDREMLNVQYHHGDLLGQDFYLQAFHRNEESSFSAFPRPRIMPMQGRYAIEFGTSKQNTQLSGLKALFDTAVSESTHLTYGLDHDSEDFDADQMFFDLETTDATGGLIQNESRLEPRYPSYGVDGLSGFVQADWTLTDNWKLSAGVRQQRMDVDVEDFEKFSYDQFGQRVSVLIPGGSNDYDATLFNASVLYDFGQHQTWFRFSQGFELPDPAKYYGKSPAVNVNDNPLSAVETDQGEFGWRFMGENWQAQTSIYYAWSDKAVVNDSNLNVVVVDNKTRDFGFEGAVTRYFEHGFQSGATLHWVRSEQEDADGDWQKRDVRYASLSSATAFLGWTNYDYSAHLQANHAFDADDATDREIDGYTTLDLTLNAQTNVGKFSLGITNLLNKQYSTVWGQRATAFYSPAYGPEYLFNFQGRGRTYTLNWTATY
ncbi:TonB-dependent receptor [Kangiella shandongensis]|uniref:TonB-dependent receptor n=1 Tax=Kangiella shandongensis TaxID=2763258 RepID=UPI001CBCDFD4|nr:TonB-dependent receptor [Kangiella shandongensis]